MVNTKNPIVVMVIVGLALVLALVGWSRYKSINNVSDASGGVEELKATQQKGVPDLPKDDDAVLKGGGKKPSGG